MSPVAKRTLDFSNVKESSGINPKHVESGEYAAKITGVTEVEAKDGVPMWLFTITPDEHRSATYPYYCKLQENQLWKVRNLFISAGLGKLVAGKAKSTVDPNKVVGKAIGILLEEDEYEGKMKSVIEAVMPMSDLEDGGVEEDPEIDVDEEEEEEVVAPKKRKAAPVVEEEDEEEEEEEAPAPKKRAKKAKPAPVEEEEEEEEEEVPAPKKRKAKAAPVVEEDEEEEDEEEEAPKPVSKRTAARRAAKAKAEPAEEEEDELDLDDL